MSVLPTRPEIMPKAFIHFQFMLKVLPLNDRYATYFKISIGNKIGAATKYGQYIQLNFSFKKHSSNKNLSKAQVFFINLIRPGT